MEFTENIPGSIIDEIALEGLEGISIPTLWMRLKARKNFPLALDDKSKNFIWKTICTNDAIEMYLLEEPRPPLVNYNRYDNLDPELEIICEPENLPEDIYPVSAVEDKVKGNRGSCATYYSRKGITSDAQKLSLEEALSRHGDCLVLVASQDVRNVALAGVHTNVLETLAINSFIMLERIGRAREHGEVTQGKHGLSRLNIPPKSSFYFRKGLLAHGLIAKQGISMRISNRNVLGTLLHLSRFYSVRLPKLLFLVKRLIEILKEAAPLYLLDYATIRTKLNTSLPLKKVLASNETRQYTEVINVPYRTVFPDASIKDWKMRNSDGEKQVKVVRLLDPTIDPEALFQGDETPPEEGSLDSDEEDNGISSSSGILWNAVQQRHHYSLIQQAYEYLEGAGCEGLTQGALAEKMGLSQLDARSVIRALSRLQVVECVVKEFKKNRVFLYIAKTHFGANSIRAQFEEEQQKVKGFFQNSSDVSCDATPAASPSPQPSFANVQLEKDVSLRHEDVNEDDGLFRPNVSRGILNEGETVSDLTHRSLKRVNLILEAVRTHLVIEEMGVLLRMIGAEEAKEGLDARMDRRSLRRLLARLSNEGQIKNMRIVLRCGERERTLNFICQPGVDQNNTVIRSAIDQAKMKLFCIGKHQKYKPEKPPKPEKLEFADNSVKLDPSVTHSVKQVKEQFGNKGFNFKAIPTSNSGRAYGTEPKCIRVREIHRLLYYLVYNYDGDLINDQDQAKEVLIANNPHIDEASFENLPDIYHTTVGWKMFIEPLPEHSGWPLGWCFLCDILLRIPLSIFIKVVTITYVIDGLEDFLKHPVKQHLLLKHLPMDIRQGLIYARKYIFSVHEVVTSMVYLGLAQFGPHSLKEKDQVFIYLNRKTSILDTTISAPGYHHITRDIEYEKKFFSFDSIEDVDKYWYEVWSICSNTLLGTVSTVAGQSITLEMLKKKPAMIEAVRTREPHEAPLLDNGEVPGDHLGAAGFDSAFFAHLKRNWTYNKATTMINRLELHVKKTGNDLKSAQTQSASQTTPWPGRLASLRTYANRSTQPPTATQESETIVIPVTVEPNVPNAYRGQKRKRDETTSSSPKPTVRWSKVARKSRPSTKPPSKTRLIVPRKQGPRRPYYDEKDRQALLLMRRLRVNWSASEDSFLLMCKVAATYLYGSLRQMVPFYVVRDCLHESFPESRNKTSRACQRRVAYMMRNNTTEYQVVNAYQELDQDPDIVTVSGGGPLTKEDRANGVEKTEELVVSRFRKLLEYLKPRYSQGGNSNAIPGLTLPNTIKEFHQQFELTYSVANLRHRRPIIEVKNVVDINCTVVFNVIHSSMCTTEEKAAWGFHLFNIYQQYPDSLVRSTLAKMRNDMVIAHRKRSFVRSKKFAEMPLSAVPFKLSITYIHLFLSRYQYPVYHNSYIHLKSVLAEKKKVPIESQGDWSGVEVSRVHEGGNAAMVVSLFALGMIRFHFQIPDQIIIFDPKLKEHPEEFENLIKRYNNWVKDVDKATENASKEDRTQQQRRRMALTTAAASNVTAALPKLLVVDETSSTSTPDESQTIQSSIRMESTASSSGEFIPASDRHQSQLIMRTASRIGLHMLREDITQENAATGHSASIQQEHFVINSCKVFIDLEVSVTPSQDWLFISPQRSRQIIDSIPTTIPFHSSMPENSHWNLYDQMDFSEVVKGDGARILQLITSKKEMGITISDLPSIVGKLNDPNCSLEQHMAMLTESQVVLRVGVVSQRYVSIQHVDPWVVKSFRLLRSGKEKLEPFNAAAINTKQDNEPKEPSLIEENIISPHQEDNMNTSQQGDNETEDIPSTSTDPLAEPVGDVVLNRRKRRIPSSHQNSKKSRTVDSLGTKDRIDLLVMVKPWVKIDGGLNRRVLDRLLGAVLSHALLKPGSSIFQLAERFHPALQPFQTRELVEILEKIGCLELYGIRKTGVAGLFAPRTKLEIVPVEKFSRDEDVFCDPKPEAIIRLGEFIGDKKYERDYIPRCTCHDSF